MITQDQADKLREVGRRLRLSGQSKVAVRIKRPNVLDELGRALSVGAVEMLPREVAEALHRCGSGQIEGRAVQKSQGDTERLHCRGTIRVEGGPT